MCKRCNGSGRGSRWQANPDQQLEASKLGAAVVRTHGLSLHPLYKTWRGMMQRCYTESHIGYPNYGGRGIAVCDEWHDVTTFIDWIERNLGQRPAGCTLDRIDNDRGYEPGNLQWSTARDQTLNRRDVAHSRGSARPLAALTEDIVRQCRDRAAAGETITVLAAEFGVSKPTMHKAVVGKTWKHVA